MKSNVLEVRNLVKNYENVKAVQSLSFSVAPGEIFGILGPNGSGKTSTLESILGTRARDGGSVSLLGMDPVKDRSAVFNKVGVQFQDSAWQAGIRVGELCESTACLYRSYPEWRPLLTQFDLEKRLKTQAQSLSGGERQKLAILLACMHRPEVIFLDELTTGLDPIARRETWRFIKQLREEGTAVVLTSHFMDEVEFLCDSVIVLAQGKKIAGGTVSEICRFGKADNLEDAYINLVAGDPGGKEDLGVKGARV